MADSYEIRQCENPACRLRYPLVGGHPFGERCPVCLGPTRVILSRRLSSEPIASSNPAQLYLEALLDNIRSAWNVGAMFRTADGLGVRKLHLCGITPTPDNPGVAKTALGAASQIPWEFSKNSLETAGVLKQSGAALWALEQDEKSLPVSQTFVWDGRPIILIAGNEITGVDPGLLDMCDRIVSIPMLGKKRSLNVEVAFGIAITALQTACRF